MVRTIILIRGSEDVHDHMCLGCVGRSYHVEFYTLVWDLLTLAPVNMLDMVLNKCINTTITWFRLVTSPQYLYFLNKGRTAPLVYCFQIEVWERVSIIGLGTNCEMRHNGTPDGNEFL